MSESTTPAPKQVQVDSQQLKSATVLPTQPSVHASLVNRLMAQNTMSSFPLVISGPILAPSARTAPDGSIIVSSVGLSAAPAASPLSGQIVKLTPGGLLPNVLSSVDNNQNANTAPVVCVLQPANLQPAMRGVLQQRIQGSATATVAGVQHQKIGSTAERPKVPLASNTAVNLTRPAVLVQAVPNASVVAGLTPTGLAPGSIRTLLPTAIRVSATTAIPVVRAPAVCVQNRQAVSATGTSAPTIQIAIRGSLDASSTSLVPTTAVRLVTSVVPTLQPKATVITDNVARDLTVHPLYRQRAPVPASASATYSLSRVAATANTTSNPTANLPTKPKVVVSSVPPKPASVVASPLHVGQTVAVNLSQSARPRLSAVAPTVSAITAAGSHSSTKTVSSLSTASTATVSAPSIGIVTIARPPRPVLAMQSQPRQKSATSVTLPQTIQLQVPSSNAGHMLNNSGVCSLVNRTAIAVNIDQINGRFNQQPDRSTAEAQQPQLASVAVLSSARTQLVLSQPLPVMVASSSHLATVSSTVSVTGTKLSQVVVTMDANRRTTLSLHQQMPSSTTSTTGQSMMSPPRPTILRKRTHDSNTPKKNLTNAINAPSDSVVGSVSKVEMLTAKVTTSPFRQIFPAADAQRDGNQSSTDTASSSSSTPGSCPQSVEKIRSELLEAVENGIIANGHVEIPRKKPRKQSLHCNEEMPAAGFSSDEDGERRADPMPILTPSKVRKQLEKTVDSSSQDDVSEFYNEDVVQFSIDANRRRFPGGLVGTQHCAWNTRSSHFTSYSDVIAKEERRQTVSELSNMCRVCQKATGWTLYHVADQMAQLCNLENETLESASTLISHMSPKSFQPSTGADSSDESRVRELVLGNIQRCKLYMERLKEAQKGLINIVTKHQPRIQDIIGRHQSKRTVKKKERL